MSSKDQENEVVLDSALGVKQHGFTPNQPVAHNISATKQRGAPKPLKSLSFLRYENLVSPSQDNFVAPTPQQIIALAEWAGLASGGALGKGALAQAANIEEFVIRRYINTKRPLEDVPTIPGPVWRYLLIRLGIIEQPTYRRSEPSTVVTQSFALESSKFELSLRAKIWYNRDEIVIDVFDDSMKSKSRKDGEPAVVITLNHSVSLESGNTIDGLLRHDDFSSVESNAFQARLFKSYEALKIRKEHVPFYCAFMDKNVWPALWRIHDFHSISPRDFLFSKKHKHSLDPFACSDEDLPTHRELLSLIGWAGIKRNDLAHIAGEKPKKMSWLLSGQGESKFNEAKTLFDQKKITAKDLSGIRWTHQISRHAWALVLAGFGLGPQIPVMGRSEPRARKVRTFEIRSVQGVPVEFVKIETSFSFTNASFTGVRITGRVSTEKSKGEEWHHDFSVTKNLSNDIAIDGATIGKNTLPPESWSDLTQRVPEVAHTYMEKAIWANLGNYLKFYHSS